MEKKEERTLQTIIKKKIVFILIMILAIISCEKNSEDFGTYTSEDSHEGTLETNPKTYPSGYGIDFETDSIVSLDEYPDFEYDLKMMTYRINDTITGDYGGRPVVFLYGDSTTTESASAVDMTTFSDTYIGSDGFDALTTISEDMTKSLACDGAFDLDTANYEWSNGYMLISEDELESYYDVLVIGDKVVDLTEDESPVYLIETSDGNYFKWQHVERQGGGHVTIRWSVFNEE